MDTRSHAPQNPISDRPPSRPRSKSVKALSRSPTLPPRKQYRRNAEKNVSTPTSPDASSPDTQSPREDRGTIDEQTTLSTGEAIRPLPNPAPTLINPSKFSTPARNNHGMPTPDSPARALHGDGVCPALEVASRRQQQSLKSPPPPRGGKNPACRMGPFAQREETRDWGQRAHGGRKWDTSPSESDASRKRSNRRRPGAPPPRIRSRRHIRTRPGKLPLAPEKSKSNPENIAIKHAELQTHTEVPDRSKWRSWRGQKTSPRESQIDTLVGRFADYENMIYQHRRSLRIITLQVSRGR